MTIWDRLREDYEDDETVLELIELCEAADASHARGPTRESHERLFACLNRYRVTEAERI